MSEPEPANDEATNCPGDELVGVIAELGAHRNSTTGLVILYRKEVLGESIAEIAAETGVSENALRLRRRRALERLRRELAA